MHRAEYGGHLRVEVYSRARSPRVIVICHLKPQEQGSAYLRPPALTCCTQEY